MFGKPLSKIIEGLMEEDTLWASGSKSVINGREYSIRSTGLLGSLLVTGMVGDREFTLVIPYNQAPSLYTKMNIMDLMDDQEAQEYRVPKIYHPHDVVAWFEKATKETT